MPEPSVLTLGDTKIHCCDARFSIHVQTEQWVERKFGPVKLPGKWVYNTVHAHTILEIEIDVDDTSGDDGAPAPRLSAVISPAGWHFATIDELANSVWQNGQHVQIEGWYGNDAPSIETDSVKFGDWNNANSVGFIWVGRFRWQRSEPWTDFKFEGSVQFSGLHISVKAADDVAPFLAAALPGFTLNRLKVEPIALTDYGNAMPDPARRRWERHSWKVAL
jgi:hypothetical protein